MNTPQQLDYNDRFQKLLEEKPFPVELISDEWRRSAISALMNASILGMGINPTDFRKIFHFLTGVNDELNCYHFAVISNTLQKQTPTNLLLGLGDYIELMMEADIYVKAWQDATNAIKEQLDKEFAEEMKAKVLASKGQQPGEKDRGLSIVKAEA